ncbi:MAG: hypothetical protein QF893_07815 [Alphaproteobacteria bacterium]|jgi:hypothetical protein|nr:hypothetical protein [Alphaproteobacteria bacterium]
MPSETRTIVFDNADIKQALADYCLNQDKGAPESGVGRLSISNDQGIAIELFAKEGGEVFAAFGEEELISALIEHCRSYKIPVPQKAQKSIVIYAGSVGLQLEIA